MRIGIVGSRDFPNLWLVRAFVFSMAESDIVVSGACRGVDKSAADAARERGMEPVEFRPDLTGCTQSHEFTRAFHARNQQIVHYCDKLVAFTEKATGGTWDAIRRARIAGKPVVIIGPDGKPLEQAPEQQSLL